MPKIQMTVIPEPKKGTAAILVKEPNFADENPYLAMSGSSDTDYLCGGCRTPLLTGIEQGKIIGLVFKCGKCQTYNVLRGTKL